ncbi:MAG: ABC transporter permease [Bacteroidota bacterium]
MLRLAIKNLLQERLRLGISLGGVVAAFFMTLLLQGVLAGATQQLVAYPQRSDADVWVMQVGVSNMHMATSVLPLGLKEAVRKVPGVKDVTPILYTSTSLQAGGRQWFSYIVGVRPGAKRGGPWAMKEGSTSTGAGEVVISFVLARKAGIGLGDSVAIAGRPFRVIGLSEETFSMANSVTFIAFEEMEALLDAQGVASYFLVKAASDTSPEDLAARIKRAVPGVNAMSREAFAESDRSMAEQMGVDMIGVMSTIGFAVGVLVIGLTIYTATVRRASEYGVVKALGTKNRQLVALIAVQTLVLSLLGLGLATAVAFLLRPLMQSVVPEAPLVYPAKTLGRLTASALSIAALASFLPACRIVRVQPAQIFKE